MLRFKLFTFLISLFIIMNSIVLAQWEVQDPGFPDDMNAIFYHAVNENVVWTVGGRELDQPVYQGFSKTTDGGETWTLGNVPAGENYSFSNIFALSDSIAWVTMVDNVVLPHEGRIFKTIDGGQNWFVQFGDSVDIQGLFNWVYFWDENEGLAVADHGTAGRIEIFKTSDGGNSWNIVAPENIPETDLTDGAEEPTFSNRWFSGDSTAWFNTDKGRVFRSVNRGKSWTAADVGLGSSIVYTSFSDDMNGLATVPILSKSIAKTTDGGVTWEITSNQLPINAGLQHINGTTNTYMYLTGNLGTYLSTGDHGYGLTRDAGESFEMEGDIPLNGVTFVNDSTGWAGSTSDNKIYKWTGLPLGKNYSTDNWQAYSPGFPDSINASSWSIADENNIWILGGTADQSPYQEFRKTTNSGSTWSSGSVPAGGEFFFTHVFAIDEDTAWVTMADNSSFPPKGRVYKTTDGGDTWSNMLDVTAPNFVHFFDKNDGLVVGDAWGENKYFIYTTQDGGNSWDRVPTSDIPDPTFEGGIEQGTNSNFSFAGDSSLWFPTDQGRIFRTTDRGYSWSVADVGLGTIYTFASFQDEQTGLATSFSSTNVAQTTDGGKTWQILPEGSSLPSIGFPRHVSGTAESYVYGASGFSDGNGFSNDGGSNWENVDELSLLPPTFIKPSVGWAGTNVDNVFYKWTGPAFPDIINAIGENNTSDMPREFRLRQNYPNPFNPSTVISYSLPVNSHVSLTIYNMLGQKVRKLVNQTQSAGIQTTVWDGLDNIGQRVASGIYFYRLEANSFMETKKMMLMQ